MRLKFLGKRSETTCRSVISNRSAEEPNIRGTSHIPYVIIPKWRWFLDPNRTFPLTLLAIMGAPPNEYSVSTQWLFPIDALRCTPSVATSGYSVGKELYDRARGVEFLFRLGSSLGLSAALVVSFASAISFSSCPIMPQAFFGNVHLSNLVSPVFHEILHGGLSQTSSHPFHSSLMYSDRILIGCRCCMHIFGD